MTRLAWITMGLALPLALGVSLVDTRPALAQGGVVCQYGPASYRRCCTQSYASKPGLGSRARANDIDACMNKGKSSKSSKPS